MTQQPTNQLKNKQEKQQVIPQTTHTIVKKSEKINKPADKAESSYLLTIEQKQIQIVKMLDDETQTLRSRQDKKDSKPRLNKIQHEYKIQRIHEYNQLKTNLKVETRRPVNC